MTYLSELENHEESISLDAEGRLTLPESVRQKLGLSAGDRLILSVSEEGVLQLVSLKHQVDSLRGILTNPNPGQSVVDEFIQERHQSAEFE